MSHEMSLECPCCGDDAFPPDARVFDGQKVECGCNCYVSADEDGADIVFGIDGCDCDERPVTESKGGEG